MKQDTALTLDSGCDGNGDGDDDGGGRRVIKLCTGECNWGEFIILAFVNARAGGGKGGRIMTSLIPRLGEKYVFDLSNGVPPVEVLTPYAAFTNVRLLVCGGDGTITWILSEIDKLKARTNIPVDFPIATIPLGTGNDLSRTLSWGGGYSSSMLKVKRLEDVAIAQRCLLDRWRIVIVPETEQGQESMPPMFSKTTPDDDDFSSDGKYASDSEILLRQRLVDLLSSASPGPAPPAFWYCGAFANYFSIGLDARVAFAFHHERDTHPERFKRGTVYNKYVYFKKGYTEGGFCRCHNPPRLKDRLKVLFRNEEDGQLEELQLPKNTRAVICLNLQSYGGGQNLTTKGTFDDGLIELICVTSLSQMAVAAGPGCVMKCFRYRIRVCSSLLRFQTSSPCYMQVDGEPWLQDPGTIQIDLFGQSPMLRSRSGCCACCC